ncbi:CubicO group peptidase (beta-lactamase class C family) [Variovorax boronicumulans]|uniref:CubicO group peptidase (Beta-lactamase class C family) n=1 Tax=Variovorax boronicumulans TaxID=436515 RepID=A0AAW8E7S1_9BURK|nr:serine hydrolase domain-containing protein [Variovorax boronicumulans]MDP9882326.1 CubicO group peptidase (beta-lactamase class C family) [Variovorax boronicumulans]MDP9920823.1 CubicO group peptidase (beta-lactamase class C family) [Variovorax boronicumulans]MDP9927612.1 CubicO group peptidase (beta-lactamase class C family) [Variovorax boronicumulans]
MTFLPDISPTFTPAWQGPDPSRIDAAIDRALAEQRLVGAVVLVRHDGRLVHRRAAGLADREAGRPMREDALFRLASVSKPIVSTAAMVLVDQGRLDLDDPVTRWLPDFRPRLPDGGEAVITLRQLLTHTAGLGYRFLESTDDGPYARAGVSDGMDRDDGLTLACNLQRLAGVPLLYPPGTGWLYSLAIDVLGAVVEAASGLPLPEAVRTLVTGPLQMHDTGFAAVPGDPRLATPYVNGPGATPPQRMDGLVVATPFEGAVGIHFDPARAFDANAWPSAGAGMVGSAGDFLRLLDTLRTGGAPLLGAATVDAMGRNHTGAWGPADAPGWGFGLGFSVLHDPQPTQTPESPGTWRWGGAYGHAWFVDRARGLSVVAFTNTLYEGMSGRFVTELRDAVYA